MRWPRRFWLDTTAAALMAWVMACILGLIVYGAARLIQEWLDAL